MSPALVLSAAAMGLLGSTHCVVMCGGVVGVLGGGLTPLGLRAPSRWRATRLVLGYNAGRIASYSAAGAIAGAFGALTDRLPAVHGAQLGLRLAVGLLMVGVGLYIAGSWPRFAGIERMGAPVWRRVEPLARRLLPARSLPAALGLGAVWGWMPCGLVYAALGAALGSGSAGGGALTMMAFGLGTLPTLLAMGTLAARLKVLLRQPRVRALAGLVVVALGLVHTVAASAQIASPASAHTCCAPHQGAH
jgi:sulfite exporter TauE/SafE